MVDLNEFMEQPHSAAIDVIWPITGLDFGVEFESRGATDGDAADAVGVALNKLVAFGLDIGDGFAGTLAAILTPIGTSPAAATVGFGRSLDGRRRRPIGIGCHSRALASRLRGVVVLKLR